MSNDKIDLPEPRTPSTLPGTWGRLVKFGFRLLYNEMAWTYDLVSWGVSLGAWRKWQLASLKFVSGKDVLEIAHGPGHMLIALHEQGFRVTGCDLSPAMGQQAGRRLEEAQLDNEIELVRCFIPDFPFKPASFDTILSQFPTNFIFEEATLTAIYQLLRPGGRLVVLPEGHLTGEGPIRRLIQWLFKITGQASSQEHPIEDHISAFETAFEQRLSKAEFKTVFEKVSLEGSEATVVVAFKN